MWCDIYVDAGESARIPLAEKGAIWLSDPQVPVPEPRYLSFGFWDVLCSSIISNDGLEIMRIKEFQRKCKNERFIGDISITTCLT
jgi:hypothetical protein